MLLDQRQFFIRESVRMFKLTDRYEILDPATSTTLGTARDVPPGWARWLRLLVKKALLPTTIEVCEHEGAAPTMRVVKRPGFIHSKVRVVLADGRVLATLKPKWFSIGGGFHLLDASGETIGEVKGDWKGWNFQLLGANGDPWAVITKKWAGLGRELFTNADQYMVALADSVPADRDRAALALGSGLAIDIVYKERRG